MQQFEPHVQNLIDSQRASLLSPEACHNIAEMRGRTSKILARKSSELLVVIGPCSLSAEEQILRNENNIAASLTNTDTNITALNRTPPWKPRTNPEDWFGLETTEPEMARNILQANAETNGNVAIEMGLTMHLGRYAHLSSLGWMGARNHQDFTLLETMATHDQSLPVAVKNSLDGEVDSTIGRIQLMKVLRSQSTAAEVALLYRGGANAQTPDEWENHLLRALDLAESRNIGVIVDVAHGSEMAHSPNGTFTKSEKGQIAALDHLVEICEREGRVPEGVMIEASDAKSLTDPVISFNEGIELARELATLKRTQISHD